MKRLRDRLDAILKQLAEMDLFDLIPRLTLVLLILYSGDYWYLKIPMTVVCTLAIIYRPVYRSPDFWLVVTVVMAAGNFRDWYTIDNHKYLMNYWCLAIFLSLLANEKEHALRVNARLLIGLSFGFATLWKCISPDYLSGRFFHFTLLLDQRFEEVAQGLAGLTEAAAYQNRHLAAELMNYDSRLQSVQLLDSSAIEPTALAITWSTILIELFVAMAFLAPDRPLILKFRHGLLIMFGLTTYSVANVVGFGWLLMVMGAANCPANWRLTRAAYVGTFFLIQVYTIPWWEILKHLRQAF